MEIKTGSLEDSGRTKHAICDQAPFLFYLANSLHRCENKEAYMCFKEGAMLRVNKSKNKRVSESC